jgi:heme/copper-type cytochrome/quinol oxidase subunit 2
MSNKMNRCPPRLSRARVVTLVGLLCALPYGCGPSEPPAEEEVEVDPNAPGVREVSPGVYDVVIIAHESIFQPSRIRVPVGAQVRFRLRSSDPTFLHSFLVAGTPLELEMIGMSEFSEATHTFDVAGEYQFVCYVYCGAGHPSMLGTITVE